MSDEVKGLLSELEAELKQQELWCLQPANPVALASTMPFCCDTMPLEQWLQFIFIPRIQALLDGNHCLPNKISILPMAEEVFKQRGEVLAPLLAIISRIDTTLSDDV